MLRYLWLLLFGVCSFVSSYEGSAIDYGGLTIQCKWDCGDEDDPYMEEIDSILSSTIPQVFGKKSAVFLDENMEEHFVTPWTVDDFECEFYDWQSANERWKPHNKKSMSFWTYSQFQQLSIQLNRDVDFYYLTAPQNLKDSYQRFLKQLQEGYEDGYRCFNMFDGEIEFSYGTFGSCFSRELGIEINSLKEQIQQIDEDNLEEKYGRAQNLIDKSVREIDSLYKKIFVYCLKNHQEEGAKFKTALESLIIGDFETAFNQICFLIDLSEKNHFNDDLISKLYLLKGQVQSEFCLYADAILALTTSIQKNPQLKESYFERAVAYFELGEFEKAIEDYLESGFHNNAQKGQNIWKTSAKLSAGIVAGIADGGVHSAIAFFPEALSTLRGLGKGLWALVLHPIDSSNAFADAAMECVQYIRKTAKAQILQDMVPELRELIQNYDQLGDYEKGSLIGQVIGRYGVDILACKYSVKAVKAYTDLKKANQAMTLEALVSPATKQKILEEAGKCWAHREATLKNGNLKVLWGQQGKHIVNDNNYVSDLNRSIWKYPKDKTQQLINDFAGAGIKSHGSSVHIPGAAGYQEIVNFGEFIGYHVDRTTGVKTATTWGKIHYAKDGVHVVPYSPRGN